MMKRLGAVLLVTLASAGVAAAQAPTPPQKPAVPAAPAAPARPGPAMTGERFGAWTVACPRDPASKAPCVMIQQISETLSRKVVFVWLLQYDDKRQLLGAFRLPSGVFVDRGLLMKTDTDGSGLKVAYTRCDPGECQAIFSISDDLAKQLSGAKTVTVQIALTNGRTADVQLDMKGFAQAIASLSAHAKVTAKPAAN
jgi:invasion protein IalB